MKNLITIVLALLLSGQISAQIIAVTEKGDTISVYENGTWEKLNKEKKSVEIETTVKATIEVDEFEKSKRIKTENWAQFGKDVAGRTINGSLIRVDDLTAFSISYSGEIGCMSEYTTTLKVKLTNGQIIEFSQVSDTDCGSSPSAIFIPINKELGNEPNFNELMSDNIDMLKQYDWETIRLNGTEYYTDIKPNPNRRIEKPEQFFRQHLIAADKK